MKKGKHRHQSCISHECNKTKTHIRSDNFRKRHKDCQSSPCECVQCGPLKHNDCLSKYQRYHAKLIAKEDSTYLANEAARKKRQRLEQKASGQ